VPTLRYISPDAISLPSGGKRQNGAPGGPIGWPLEPRMAKTHRKLPRQHLWTYMGPIGQEVVGCPVVGFWSVLPLRYNCGRCDRNSWTVPDYESRRL
jgi:hypothetical protein